MNIILIGFMGTGKTTVSRELGLLTGSVEIDVDRYIVEKEGRPIPDIFAEDGEEAFRDRESEAFAELSQTDGRIISCGGGAVLRQRNVDYMKKNGRVVLLTADARTIYERIKDDDGRPVLRGRNSPEAIAELMEARRPYYEAAADIVVKTDGKSAQTIAEEILEAVKTCAG